MIKSGTLLWDPSFIFLQTFPEPLLFNKETGGFEIVTDEKQRLAEEIKAAVRAGRRRKKIYRHVRNNAFTPIPLIPMEEPPLVEEKEIDTSFSVQVIWYLYIGIKNNYVYMDSCLPISYINRWNHKFKRAHCRYKRNSWFIF